MIYKLYKTIPQGQDGVLCKHEDGTTSSFLLGTDNPEEKAYLEWLALGNVPESAE